MKFEKKVIVGSITSFIITAVGIVAVFFPDLLNLQKEKILSLKVDLDTQKDIEKFENFLNARVKDNKIFKLDVCMPEFAWADNKWLGEAYFSDEIKPSANQAKNISYDYEYAFREHSKDDFFRVCIASINNDLDYYYLDWCNDEPGYYKDESGKKVGHIAIDFHGENFLIVSEDGNNARNKLNFNRPCRTQIDGYFYFDGLIPRVEMGYYDFREIDKKEIKLKSY
ncbi:hypothetical protein O6B96_05715 [Campylobacter ureolyticus]|uniref:hypothetical protein n=1 Tax=Campylobacter ureolyticus TaxID=827 RepID=UPI0022B501B6|nr:hypothetical protein [Campylobacter ureolyticus]MCZ6150539.1 hypothetical protein [Campylobacter ureolyticus]